MQPTLRAEHAPDTDAYAAKYAELKEANVKEVDRYLTVIGKIVGDKDLLAAVSVPKAAEAFLEGEEVVEPDR